MARLQDRGREGRVIRRVGEVLRLQRQRPAMAVDLTAFAPDRAVEEVARVELNSRLVGVDVESAAAGRLDDSGGMVARAAAVEHPIMVVTARDLELLVRLVDT